MEQVVVTNAIGVIFTVFVLVLGFTARLIAKNMKTKEDAQDKCIENLTKSLEQSVVYNNDLKALTVKMLNILQGNDITILRDRLYQSCIHYLSTGIMTKDDLLNLTSLFNRYIITGGNGQIKLLYEKVLNEVRILEEEGATNV